MNAINKKYSSLMNKDTSRQNGTPTNQVGEPADNVEEISYKHYKIFNGNLSFELSESKTKSLEKVKFQFLEF